MAPRGAAGRNRAALHVPGLARGALRDRRRLRSDGWTDGAIDPKRHRTVPTGVANDGQYGYSLRALPRVRFGDDLDAERLAC